MEPIPFLASRYRHSSYSLRLGAVLMGVGAVGAGVSYLLSGEIGQTPRSSNQQEARNPERAADDDGDERPPKPEVENEQKAPAPEIAKALSVNSRRVSFRDVVLTGGVSALTGRG